MATQTIGIIVHGATGRIASTQHLANALLPICAEGGLPVGDDRVVPRLLLAGRNAERVAAVARSHGIADWTTDLDAAFADPGYAIFFDAAATQQRAGVLEKAIAAGKHIYSEKPVAPTVAQAHALLREGRSAWTAPRRRRGQGLPSGHAEARASRAKRRAWPHRRLPP